MANEIEQMLNDIAEYQKVHGEDKDCLLAKANLFTLVGENEECLKCLEKAMKLAPDDTDVLYSMGVSLEKSGDPFLACVYFGLAAKNGNPERQAEIAAEFSEVEYNFRSIFETAMCTDKTTFILLSNCNFDDTTRRMPLLSLALTKLRNKVVYICPAEEISTEKGTYAETLVSKALSEAESKDGVLIIKPVRDTGSGIDTYDIITNKLADAYRLASFVVSDPDSYNAVKQLKNKNKIIFDYNGENCNGNIDWLIRWADAVILRDAVSDDSLARPAVYTSEEDASPVSLACQVMRIAAKKAYPEEKADIAANSIALVAKDSCTGCSSCFHTCPKNAISMKPDEMGFSYPEIDENSCVNCGLCVEHCPVLAPYPITCGNNECYAAMAPSDIRSKSSSGGMFSLLASRTLKKGGCICGAVYDEKFDVKHIITDNIHEIEKMRGSKYVQSDISDMYPKIKAILHSGRHVMFTGCSCQVAGLYSYLGENPENLLTMSFVCAGVPSPAVYRKHLDSITPEGAEITNLSFRDKNDFGWNTGISANFSDETRYSRFAGSDPYMNAFLSGAIVRPSCHNCSFKDDLYSDIEVGDFWGIANTVDFDDGLGTSYVSINSPKGEAAMRDCFLNFIKMARLPKRNAIFSNPRINSPLPRPAYKERFLKNYAETKNLSDTFNKTFTEQHFDAVLVLWWSANYGNALTNYALYSTLDNMGLRLLALDNLVIAPTDNFLGFAKRYYNLSSDYFPQGSYDYIPLCSDNFIVGSDQVWNAEFSIMLGHNGYFQLKFLPDGKNMISYGSSFGQAANAVEQRHYAYYKKLYDRFNHVSLREKNGADAMKTVFGIDAEYVLDPVFLLTKKEYGELSKDVIIPEKKPYILTYIINPSPKKNEYLRKLSEKLGMEIINILDAEPVRTEQNMTAFDIGIKKPKLSPEEFAAYFRDCDYVVTDSYHGTCFSVIFEKKFTAFVNRQSDRFRTFLEFEELKSRILGTVPEEIPAEVMAEINYTPVNAKLEKMREDSIAYLRKALKL